MTEMGGRRMVRLAVGVLLLGIGWCAVGQNGVTLTASTDALIVENEYFSAMIDLAHGGSLTTLNLKDWSMTDIVDNFRIQVVINDEPPRTSSDLLDDDLEGAWVWHGGPGFLPNEVITCHVLRCEPDAVIIRVKASFKEQQGLNDWGETDESRGMTAVIMYYFFDTRMFFVTWSLSFEEDKQVRRASIEAIPIALADDQYPRHWAYWGVDLDKVDDKDDGGRLRHGLFASGWTHVSMTSVDLGGEYWSDTWGTDLGFGRIILDINQLMPQQLMELCAKKPPNIERERWTGLVDSWINVPSGPNEVSVEAGTVFSATMLYTAHPGDYTYMQTLYHTLHGEGIPDFKTELEGLWEDLKDSFSRPHPFPQVEDSATIKSINELASSIRDVEEAVVAELKAD